MQRPTVALELSPHATEHGGSKHSDGLDDESFMDPDLEATKEAAAQPSEDPKQEALQAALARKQQDWIVAAFILLLGAAAVFTLLLLIQIKSPSTGFASTAPTSLYSAGLSSATAPKGEALLLALCGFLEFSDGGSLILYQASQSTGIATPVWESQAPQVGNLTAVISNSSTSNGSDTTTTTTTVTAGTKALASYTLRLDRDGRLAVHPANSLQFVIWSNRVSISGGAPFRLQVRCNGSQPVLQETDGYGNVVWQSAQQPGQLVLAASRVKQAELASEEPLAGFLQVAMEVVPRQTMVAQAQQAGSSSLLLTRESLVQAGALLTTTTTTTTTTTMNGSRGGSSGTGAAAAAQDQQQQQPQQQATSAASSAPAWHQNLVFLENAFLKLGFDLALGGALAFLSTTAEPGLNLISSHDPGRLVQQSYYGSKDGSSWVQVGRVTAWRYNPVQGGSSDFKLGSLLSHTLNQTSGCFSSRSLPRHWASGELLTEVQMWQTVCLNGRLVEMALGMKYSGSQHHTPSDQELPAAYLHRSFSDLVTYSGDRPFTQDSNLSTVSQDWESGPSVALKHDATEHWAAYVRPSDKLAVGLYFPHTTKYVAYAYGPPGRALEPWTCSYLAPVSVVELAPGTTVAYKAYMYVGRVQDVRAAFYKQKYLE